RSGSIPKIRSRAKVAVFVRERPVEHEDLFSERMPVSRERRTRIVANDAGRMAALGLFARERLSPHARPGTRLPAKIVRADDDPAAEIHVEHRRQRKRIATDVARETAGGLPRSSQ